MSYITVIRVISSALLCFLISSPTVEAYYFNSVRYNIKHGSFGNSIAILLLSQKLGTSTCASVTKAHKSPDGGDFHMKETRMLPGNWPVPGVHIEERGSQCGEGQIVRRKNVFSSW